MKIKTGDKVLIKKGKDRGKEGKVIKVFPEKDRVVVEGLNLSAKHVRPQKQGEKGKVIKVAMPIHASNLRLVCSKCGPTRAGQETKKGKRVRVCKKCSRKI